MARNSRIHELRRRVESVGAPFTLVSKRKGRGGEDREENSLLRLVWWDAAAAEPSQAGKATKGKLYRFRQTDRARQQPVQYAPTFSQDIFLCSTYVISFHTHSFHRQFIRTKILLEIVCQIIWRTIQFST